MTLRFFLIFGEIAIEKYAETASEIDNLLFALETGAKIYIFCKKDFRVKLTFYLRPISLPKGLKMFDLYG